MLGTCQNNTATEFWVGQEQAKRIQVVSEVESHSCVELGHTISHVLVVMKVKRNIFPSLGLNGCNGMGKVKDLFRKILS